MSVETNKKMYSYSYIPVPDDYGKVQLVEPIWFKYGFITHIGCNTELQKRQKMVTWSIEHPMVSIKIVSSNRIIYLYGGAEYAEALALLEKHKYVRIL